MARRGDDRGIWPFIPFNILYILLKKNRKRKEIKGGKKADRQTDREKEKERERRRKKEKERERKRKKSEFFFNSISWFTTPTISVSHLTSHERETENSNKALTGNFDSKRACVFSFWVSF